MELACIICGVPILGYDEFDSDSVSWLHEYRAGESPICELSNRTYYPYNLSRLPILIRCPSIWRRVTEDGGQ